MVQHSVTKARRSSFARAHPSTPARAAVSALALAPLLSLALLACGKPAPDMTPTDADIARPDGIDAARLADGSAGADWPGYGRTYGETHFSPLTEIDTASVGKLSLASFLDLPPGPVATQPVVVDGIIYISTGLSIVRAIDAVSGKELWLYDPKVAQVAGSKMVPTWGNRGIAYWNGKVYTGTVDGRLIAIDAKSGQEVWSAATTQPGDGRYITGAPRLLNGRIIVGHGGADTSDVRGYVTAYDAETGRQLWRFFTVPGNPANGFENDAMAKAAKTWSGEWWKYGGGGTAWNAFAYDPETDTVFVGTGNGAPWNRQIRSQGKGDNLYLCSILALDAKTGAYKWHYQVNPGETWDYNAAMDMHLADVRIGGRTYKALIQAPKNGFVYVIDRTNGKLLAANKFAKVTWATRIDLASGRPVEVPGIRFENGASFEMWPSYTGAHSSNASAFDPRNGTIFIPVIERGAIYNDRGVAKANWQRRPGNVHDFGVVTNFAERIADPLHNTSALLAMDAVTGKQLWRIRTPRDFNGGLMATAGNLVFQGQNDNRFNAYDMRSGKRLWSFDAQAPVIAAPVTYAVKGRQYVTVIAGMGTSGGNVMAVSGYKDLPDYRDQPRRVLTFAIDGTAALPTLPPRQKAPADPDYRSDPAMEAAGKPLFDGNCLSCHGPGGMSGGGAPRLTRSPVILSEETFESVVHDGALKENGMPQFGTLTKAQLAAIRQYLRSSAKADRQR